MFGKDKKSSSAENDDDLFANLPKRDSINEVKLSESQIQFLADRVMTDSSYKAAITDEIAGTDKNREIARENFRAVLKAYDERISKKSKPW